MKPYWQGVFPAVTTQMHPDGSLDLEGTARHLEVLRRGIADRPGTTSPVAAAAGRDG